jgi:hypothetical protein
VLDLEGVETAGEREGPVRLRESAGWEREETGAFCTHG